MAQRNRPKISFAEIITSPRFWENYNKCLEMSYERKSQSGFLVHADSELKEYNFTLPKTSTLFECDYEQLSKKFELGTGFNVSDDCPIIMLVHTHLPKGNSEERSHSYIDLLNLRKFKKRNMRIKSPNYPDHFVNPISVVGSVRDKNRSQLELLQERKNAPSDDYYWNVMLRYKRNEWAQWLNRFLKENIKRASNKNFVAYSDEESDLSIMSSDFGLEEGWGIAVLLDLNFYNVGSISYDKNNFNLAYKKKEINEMNGFENSLYLKITRMY